jgi:hypothetical protein
MVDHPFKERMRIHQRMDIGKRSDIEFTPFGVNSLNTLLTSRCQRKCVFPVGIHIINTFTDFGIDNRRKVFLLEQRKIEADSSPDQDYAHL